MFSGCTIPHDSKETNLGSCDQEASTSVCENTKVVLVPCHAWKLVPTAISGGVDISKVPVCSTVFSCTFPLHSLIQGPPMRPLNNLENKTSSDTYQRVSLQLFRNTTGIHSGPDAFDMNQGLLWTF